MAEPVKIATSFAAMGILSQTLDHISAGTDDAQRQMVKAGNGLILHSLRSLVNPDARMNPNQALQVAHFISGCTEGAVIDDAGKHAPTELELFQIAAYINSCR